MSRSTQPLFGYTTFAEAFPEIKSAAIEFEQTETRVPKEKRSGRYFDGGIPAVLPCDLKQCKNGGFSIQQQILNRMVQDRQTELSDTIRCNGHESFGYGTRGPSCGNFLKFTVRIVYQEPKTVTDEE